MKSLITFSSHMGFVAIAILATALVTPATAKHGVPIKGTIQAVETSYTALPPEVATPTLFVEAGGSGRATRLGRFAVTYTVQVDLATFFGVGSAKFVAANGDTLSTDGEGQGTVPTADGTSFIEETHTITGGTGRFEGASGSFVVKRVINVLTGVTSGSFKGTIVLDKGK